MINTFPRTHFRSTLAGFVTVSLALVMSGCVPAGNSSSSISSVVVSSSHSSVSSAPPSSSSSSSSSVGSNANLPNSGPARSLGYLGCSMSVNVAEGYQMLGGKRLWPPIAQYNGQVVQNWAKDSDPVWGAFDNATRQYGTPDAVWVMLCIFSNQVTIEETRQIVANVRKRAPAATIYVTGQPVYDNPNSCFLAGNGGPDKTDRIAKQAGDEAALNVIYPGKLGPLAANENSDGCHANDSGRRKLGQQFIGWFGK